MFRKKRSPRWRETHGDGTYLCADPQNRSCDSESGRGEKGRVGKVKGEEDEIPEEILWVYMML